MVFLMFHWSISQSLLTRSNFTSTLVTWTEIRFSTYGVWHSGRQGSAQGLGLSSQRWQQFMGPSWWSFHFHCECALRVPAKERTVFLSQCCQRGNQGEDEVGDVLQGCRAKWWQNGKLCPGLSHSDTACCLSFTPDLPSVITSYPLTGSHTWIFLSNGAPVLFSPQGSSELFSWGGAGRSVTTCRWGSWQQRKARWPLASPWLLCVSTGPGLTLAQESWLRILLTHFQICAFLTVNFGLVLYFPILSNWMEEKEVIILKMWNLF